jgi:hypothetical protein
MPESRCLVPANSFAEHAPEPNPETKGRTWCGSRSTRTGPCSRSLVSGLSSRAEALVLITKGGGPMAMARIGMMQDAALQIADAVQTTKIGRRPKSPVMLLGPESYFD